MKKTLITLAAIATISLGTVGAASAAPNTGLDVTAQSGVSFQNARSNRGNARSNRGQVMRNQNCMRRVYRACMRRTSGNRYAAHFCSRQAYASCS